MSKTLTQQNQITSEEKQMIANMRAAVRGGNLETLKRLLPLVEQHQLFDELHDDLNAMLDRAIADNHRGNMTAVQQMAALLGDQDMLLRAQSALIPDREIVLEDDSDIMNEVLGSFSMKNLVQGERGMIDAPKPVYTGKPGELAEGWEKDGLLPDEEDIDYGPSRDEYGRG